MLAEIIQEIKQNVNYIKIITTSARAKWKVSSSTFSLTISDEIDRTFSKTELESYEQQIKYFLQLKQNLLTDDTIYNLIDQNKFIFNAYLKMLENIRNKYKMCSKECFLVHDPIFEGDQSLINQEEIVLFPKIQDCKDVSINYLNFTPKFYHNIGNYILNEADKHCVDIEIFKVFQILGYNNIRFDIIDDFICFELFKYVNINPIEVGRKFVEFLHKEKDKTIQDFRKYDLPSKIKTHKSFADLYEFITNLNNEKIHIARVPKPSHTFHLIQPAYALWSYIKGMHSLCPLENILFCEEDNNFVDLLNVISESNNSDLYFIVHPENLRDDDMQYLKKFITTRRNMYSNIINESLSKDHNKLNCIPKIMIITALPISFFNLEEDQNYYHYFSDEKIADFATFNAQIRRTLCNIHNDVFLFSSECPEQGKTYHINEIIKNAKKQFSFIKENEELDDKDNIKSIDHIKIYLDKTTNEIPESIIDKSFIHFSISPELFLNNSNIFDQLYVLIQYGFFNFKSNKFVSFYIGVNIIPTFLIEIPNFNEKNSFMNFYDFPVAPSNNEIKWGKDNFSKNIDIYSIITNEFNGIGNEKFFINGLFHLKTDNNLIVIDNINVKTLVNLLFTNTEINNYVDLINESKSLFFGNYTDFDNKDNIGNNRIMFKFRKMITDYSNQIMKKYNTDDKMKKILFLLAIRTALNVWHFTPSKDHSIILLIPKRLMTKTPFDEKNGWLFVSFYSKVNDDIKWKKEVIKDIGFDDDKSLIENSLTEFDKEKDFHILTDSKLKIGYDFLQNQIFEALLQLLPNLDFDHKDILNIRKISFSKNYFRILIEVILKIYYRHFSILQGETGCGISSLIQVLNDIITFAKNDPKAKTEINWNIFTIDFHGSFDINDFDNEINRIMQVINIDDKDNENMNDRNIIFLDHFNKSPAYYYAINYVQNSNNEYISFIASTYPYVKLNSITKELLCGVQNDNKLQHNKSKLFVNFSDDIKELTKISDDIKYLYDVKKPPESVKLDYILMDPQEFYEENPQYLMHDIRNSKYSLCFSDEEKNMIRLIIKNILLQPENNINIELNYIVDLLSKLISDIFITVRSFMKLRAIFSYRDVSRCTILFIQIFDYFHKKKVDKKLPIRSKEKNKFWYKIASISAIISIYVSLISRFRHEEINTNRLILERFKHHPFKELIGKNHQTICIYKLVLNYISNEDRWPSEKLPYVKIGSKLQFYLHMQNVPNILLMKRN